MSPESSAATATAGLQVEPGVYRPCSARLNSGRLSSALYSLYWVAYRFWSKLGDVYKRQAYHLRRCPEPVVLAILYFQPVLNIIFCSIGFVGNRFQKQLHYPVMILRVQKV